MRRQAEQRKESGLLRADLLRGAASVLPLLLGVVPFALVFGVTAAATSVPAMLSWSTSWIIFAGAAQLAVVGLLDQGAPALIVVATAWIINARFLMYSASLAPHFAGLPTRWKLFAPYVLTDQAYVMSVVRYSSDSPPRSKISFYLGAAMTLWLVWQTVTGIGVLLGASVPASWSLGFAVPLTFLALLVPAINSRPALVAASVGGLVALVGDGLPFNLGLITGAVAGVAAGAAAEALRDR